MAFGNLKKKPTFKKASNFTKGYSIPEDTIQSIFQSYLMSISFLDDNKHITELKIGEPKKNSDGVMTRWVDITTKDIK